ncbi:hypothetical protein ABEB36_004564 [Hypothenemus hampei]|uniref:Uncharacterized protein n=1 Tax=Hypothenemus hampei TaxID=57062 RepID=A0ABD1F3T7_HYPHA
MFHKEIILFTLILCGILHYTFSRPTLLDQIQTGLKNTTCKIHNIRIKIVGHDHYFGDPCGHLRNNEINKEEIQTAQIVDHSTKSYTDSSDIDLRLASDENTNKSSTSTNDDLEGFKPVPDEGGRNIEKGCKENYVNTIYGCQQKITSG